jgi:hypothetical protein
MPTLTVQFSDYSVDEQGLHPTNEEIRIALKRYNDEHQELSPGMVVLSLLAASWAVGIAIVWGILQVWELFVRRLP